MKRFSCSFLVALSIFASAPLAYEEIIPQPATAAYSISFEKFKQLSHTEQVQMVLAAFTHRMDVCRNLMFSSSETRNMSRLQNGQVTEELMKLSSYKTHFWGLNGFSRIIRIGIAPDGKTPFETVSLINDSATESVKYLAMPDMPLIQIYGRIEPSWYGLTEYTRFILWLDGKDSSRGEHFIRKAIENGSQMKVEITGSDEIVASVPWKLGPNVCGERKFTLDSRKGFLPLRVSGYWETANLTSRLWRREEIYVDDSQLVGDVWMPVNIRDVITSSILRDDSKANVHTTVVDSISIGEVQDSDMSFIFPPGTEVTDAIGNLRYKIGPTGEQTDVQLIANPIPVKKALP